MIEKIKYAIFDMDGTLVDSLGYFDYLWKSIGIKYFSDPTFKIDPNLDRDIRTKTLKDAVVQIRDAYLPNENEDELFELASQGLEEHYKLRVGPKADVIKFLELMKSKGVKMCVASATEPKYIKYSIERCGLEGYFEFIISCTEVGAGKDKPDVFLEALRRLGGNLESACVFEDSFTALETAKRAGFMTVGIYDKNNYCQDRLESASNFYVAEGMTLMDFAK